MPTMSCKLIVNGGICSSKLPASTRRVAAKSNSSVQTRLVRPGPRKSSFRKTEEFSSTIPRDQLASEFVAQVPRSRSHICKSSANDDMGTTPDTEAVVRYLSATTLQWGLLMGSLWGLDFVTNSITDFGVDQLVAKVIVIAYFLTMSLKSRVFSPLDNSRPTTDESGKKISVMDGLKRPSWMPPPLAFPIIWSTIALLRTASSVVIWETCGRNLLVVPIAAMMLHLSIGDTWNTINNVEKRRGTAVVGVGFVWLSVLTAVKLYYDTDPLAGGLLAPSAAWISVAFVLVYTIWDLNGRDPIMPMK